MPYTENEPNPSNIDLAITRRAISACFADQNYPVEIASEIFAGIDLVEHKNPNFYINPQTRAKAINTIRTLASNQQIDQTAAKKTIEILERQGPLPVALQQAAGLQMGIEQIAEYAKKEVSGIIEYEKLVAQLSEVLTLSTLERAVCNLEIVNGWVADGTWLNQYLDRARKSVTLYRSKLEKFLLTNSYGSIPVFLGGLAVGTITNQPIIMAGGAFSMIGMMYGSLAYAIYSTDDRCRSITLTNQKLRLNGRDGSPLSANFLQRTWDRGNKTYTNSVAGLNRVKTAEKIYRSINT